jgi:hypothetical protein
MNKNAICEVKIKGRWREITVKEAIARKLRPARCRFKNCHGRVRLCRPGGKTSPCHYEHNPAFAGCEASFRHQGKKRRNPNPLK